LRWLSVRITMYYRRRWRRCYRRWWGWIEADGGESPFGLNSYGSPSRELVVFYLIIVNSYVPLMYTCFCRSHSTWKKSADCIQLGRVDPLFPSSLLLQSDDYYPHPHPLFLCVSLEISSPMNCRNRKRTDTQSTWTNDKWATNIVQTLCNEDTTTNISNEFSNDLIYHLQATLLSIKLIHLRAILLSIKLIHLLIINLYICLLLFTLSLQLHLHIKRLMNKKTGYNIFSTNDIVVLWSWVIVVVGEVFCVWEIHYPSKLLLAYYHVFIFTVQIQRYRQ
jgi:hypothetical protein